MRKACIAPNSNLVFNYRDTRPKFESVPWHAETENMICREKITKGQRHPFFAKTICLEYVPPKCLIFDPSLATGFQRLCPFERVDNRTILNHLEWRAVSFNNHSSSFSTDSASRLILSWRTTRTNVTKKAGQPSQKSGTKVSRFCRQRRVKNEAFMVALLEANRFWKIWMSLSLGDFFSTNQVFRFRVLGSTFKFGPGIPTLYTAYLR